MDTILLGLALVGLLTLNAFFVLAEFAIVKVRPSRVAELSAEGHRLADRLAGIQHHLDQYLGVCQIGITLASVALGMVGQQITDRLLAAGTGHSTAGYVVALVLPYVLVSGSHIVLGEQVPKFIGIRASDRAALASTRPLRLFRLLFRPLLFALTGLTNLVLRLIGLGRPQSGEQHSEEELRIILDQSQGQGLMSFRRLIFLENIFDFGELAVRDAMRGRAAVRSLDASRPWAENLAVIRNSRFTRYPVLPRGDGDRPIGFVHLKDLVIRTDADDPDLRTILRPLLTVTEATSLENLLADMQRRRVHAALVNDAAGRWVGFITLEDILEEIVGTIRDEFEDEEPARLADAITPERVHLHVEADSPMAAVRSVLRRMPAAALPVPCDQLLAAIEPRERLVSTYLGAGIGLPHARVPNLPRPVLLLIRSEQGVPFEGTTEKGRLMFVLFTPAGQPRVHQRLLSIIATLLHESEYVRERLITAESVDEVIEVIKTGEQAVLD
ncbi:MAG TPA: CNNM domain-containing protein [Kofleriaceae bacterium]|nr:CNNM domain-containing protein [Kofleriaceae bacterium]